MVAQWVELWTCDQQVVDSNRTRGKAAQQPLASCSHICASVTKQYNLVLAKGRWCSATGKVTAGLAESNGSLPLGGWLIVTCGLTACTPGLALGPTLINECGKPLLFYIDYCFFHIPYSQQCRYVNIHDFFCLTQNHFRLRHFVRSCPQTFSNTADRQKDRLTQAIALSCYAEKKTVKRDIDCYAFVYDRQ